MKSLEQMLQEKEKELIELRGPRARNSATADISALKLAAKKTLVQQLSESGLPEAAQTRLRTRLAKAGAAEVKAAISQEREYVLQVQKAQYSPRLVESYRLLGLSSTEASIAAGVEAAVTNISESREKLANAAQLLGLSKTEAEAFSRI